jgi:hypothetical protein
VAAIPDAVGARCASRGVIRTMLRVAVLGGLVVTGWLLGSGVGQAQPDTVHESQVRPSDLSQMIDVSPPDDDFGGLLKAPTVARSAVAEVMRAVPLSSLPVHPAPVHPGQTPALDPVLQPVSKLAALVPPIAKSAAQSRPATTQPAAVKAVTPTAQAVAVAAVSTPAPVLRTAADPPSDTPVCRAAQQAADPSADQLAVPSSSDVGPVTALPTSSPGTTTEPCPVGNAGSGSITTSTHSVTLSDKWSTVTLTPTQCQACRGASGIPQSAAHRPSTSPD